MLAVAKSPWMQSTQENAQYYIYIKTYMTYQFPSTFMWKQTLKIKTAAKSFQKKKKQLAIGYIFYIDFYTKKKKKLQEQYRTKQY